MSLDNAKVFLFDVNFNEELRTKLKELMSADKCTNAEERVESATAAARKLGYDFDAQQLKTAMAECGNNDALELEAVTSHAGVCTSTVQNRDTCAASVETGIWCTAQTSPATVGSTFMSM